MTPVDCVADSGSSNAKCATAVSTQMAESQSLGQHMDKHDY